MNFEKDFPNAVIIRLEKNFRSSEHILNAASSLISNNLNRIDKTLIPAAPTENPQKVRLVTVGSDRDEGLWIARRIRTLYPMATPIDHGGLLPNQPAVPEPWKKPWFEPASPTKSSADCASTPAAKSRTCSPSSA